MTPLMRIVTFVTVVVGTASRVSVAQQNPVVVFDTEKGAIEVEVDAAR